MVFLWIYTLSKENPICVHLERTQAYKEKVVGITQALWHLGKAIMVANALSRLSMGSISHVIEENRELAIDFHGLAHLGVGLMDSIEEE